MIEDFEEMVMKLAVYIDEQRKLLGDLKIAEWKKKYIPELSATNSTEDINMLREKYAEKVTGTTYAEDENFKEIFDSFEHGFEVVEKRLNKIVVTRGTTSKEPQLDELIRVLGVLLLQLELLKGAYPVRPAAILNVDSLKEYILSERDRLLPVYSQKIYSYTSDGANNFLDLYEALFGMPIETVARNQSTIKNIENTFANETATYTREDLLPLAYGIKLLAEIKKKNSKKKIDNMYHYWRKIMEKGNYTKKNSSLDFFDKEETFNKLTQNMRKANISAESYVFYANYGDDMLPKLYMDKVLGLPAIRKDLEIYKVLILNPGPILMQELAEIDKVEHTGTMYVGFAEKDVASIYQIYHPEMHIFWYDIDTTGTVKFYELKKPEESFTEVEGFCAQSTLIFDYPAKKDIHELLKGLHPYFDPEEHKLRMIVSEKAFSDYFLREDLANWYGRWDISILPAEFYKSSIKKCNWIEMGQFRSKTEKDKIDTQTDMKEDKTVITKPDVEIRLRHIFFDADAAGNDVLKKGTLIEEPFDVYANRKAVLSLEGTKIITVKGIFEQCRPKPEKGRSRVRRSFEFSREITIAYNMTKGQGDYAYYSVDHPQGRNGEAIKGKKLFERSLRLKQDETIEDYMWRNMLKGDDEKSLHAIIGDDIDTNFQELPYTLKTYWICRLDVLRDNFRSRYDESVCIDLFKSEVIANLMSDHGAEINAEDVMDELKKCGRKNIKTCLVQLDIILRLANDEDRFVGQQITAYLQKLQHTDKKKNAVRQAMQKKTFTEVQQNATYQALLKGVESGDIYALAATISFFTGLSDQEVAGLNWGDYTPLAPGQKTYHMLKVQRQMANGNSIPVSFPYGQSTKNRNIPIVSVLDGFLKRYKKEMEQTYGPRKVADPIFFEMVKSHGKTIIERLDYHKIRQAKLSLLHGVGIIADREITNEKNTKEDEDPALMEYFGDRFRMNFEFQLFHVANMEDVEVAYVLGRKQYDVDGEHYCDYRSSGVQDRLHTEMERWASRFIAQEDVKTEHTFTSAQTLPLTALSDQRTECDARFKVLTEDTTIKVGLKIHDDHGVDVILRRMKTYG